MVFVSPKPLDPATIRETIEKVVNDPHSVPQDNPGAHGAMVGKLNEACGGDEGRYAVLWWLFPHKWGRMEEVSSKALTGLEWYALQRWIGMREVQGEWMTRATFKAECEEIMAKVLIADMDAKVAEAGGWTIPWPLMACGHVADMQMESGKPYCSQCWMGGRNPDAEYEVK